MTAPDLDDTTGQTSSADGALDRRSMLLLAGGVVGTSALGRATGTAGAFSAPGDDPVSMAMHIHSSFSEGTASMATHLDQARRLGVDVIWWTDHDFRQTAHGYRNAIDFDGASEPEGHWDLTWSASRDGSVAQADHAFVTTPTTDGGGGSLRTEVTSKSTGSWATYLLEAQAQNSMYSTSYADTTVSLDVRPEQIDSDRQLIVEIASSYRPRSGERRAGYYRIQYRIGNEAGYELDDDGRLGIVKVRARQAGQFQRLTLDLRADHRRLWPDTVADDASLWRLRVGVRSRNGERAIGYFDRLRFHRDRARPSDGAALLEKAVAQYRRRYPGITQFAAAEISLVQHLNSFGGDGTLPRYRSAQAVKNDSPAAQQAMVRFLKRHGATVGINHPLGGSGGADALARRLIAHRGLGAHSIEVGTRGDVKTMARVFDTAARNAVFLTANGSTDDHSGTDWLSQPARWLTRVWSPTRRRQDLCWALEAGRAWFYDPTYWDGLLDLRVNGRAPMGGVHFAVHPTFDLDVRATQLPRHASLEVVVGRCDLAGVDHLSPVNHGITVRRSQLRDGRWSRTLRRRGGVYVRAAVRLDGGRIVGFSNPVWVLPPSRRDDVDVPRPRR